MSDWNLQTGTLNATTWQRSWRQELFTDLGSNFRFVAHMEEVSTFEGSDVVLRKALPEVTRKMSDVYQDPDVQELNALLTKLVKKWMDEDNRITQPVVDSTPTGSTGGTGDTGTTGATGV